MIIRAINLVLLLAVMVSACILITKRFSFRNYYTDLANLKNGENQLNTEYTKLQIEEGTYSSSLVLQTVALKQLGLVEPDKKHIMEEK